MYADRFFDLIGVRGFAWVGVAVLYALVNYVYDVVMCWITGGVQNLSSRFSLRGGRRLIIRFRQWIRKELPNFETGGRQRWHEFRDDTLSWVWPLTVLAVPTLIYGATRSTLIVSVDNMTKEGINIIGHRQWPFAQIKDDLQLLVWVLALIPPAITLYRYQHRSKLTWFARSLFFHASRALLFDMVLAYMVLNTILMWIDFSTALYVTLRDGSVQYPILHPDLQYGLQSAHSAIIVGIFLIFLMSILPTIMLIREKKETYSWTYYGLIYLGILCVAILSSILVFQFNKRLGIIHENALGKIVRDANLSVDTIANTTTNSSTIAALEYLSFVSKLPDGFKIPDWISFLLSARVFLLFYEMYILLSTNEERPSIASVFRKILEI
ncbi:MAG: hypothetical protein KC415_11990 [Anaerolineales bacterium]|nr:hypothetical protein [Anaerolineales bacterium]